MKRLMRILLNLATALSLLLMAAAVASWARSYVREEGISYFHPGSQNTFVALAWLDGRLIVAWVTEPPNWDRPIIDQKAAWRWHSGDLSGYTWNLLIFAAPDSHAHWVPDLASESIIFTRGKGRITIIPLAYASAIGALLPCWRIVSAARRRRRLKRRRRTGCCLRCGYDLRATPEADGAMLARCPECGAERKPCGT